jgi:hypothetical protein
MPQVHWTPSGVRLRRRVTRAGDLHWLFLSGGPGLGSESLHELVDTPAVVAAWMQAGGQLATDKIPQPKA